MGIYYQLGDSDNSNDTIALSRVATEFRTSGNPMTYITREGRQFVVIATGAGPDASLVAFALPEG